MSDSVEEFLSHVGVKGMKWGVRRAQKKAAKADAKWQKNIYTMHSAIALHNHVAGQMNNGGLDRLNGNPKYKNKKLLDVDTGEPIGALGKQYMKDYENLTLTSYKKAVADVHGTSPSGQFKATFDTSDKNNPKVVVSKVDVVHASLITEDLVFEVDFDSSGIVQMAMVKDPLQHSSVEVEEFLAHVGVKGMKWGVRKARKPSTKGYSREAKAAANIRRKAKTSPVKVKSLSNKEIETFLARNSLEARFNQATPGPGQKTLNIVKDLLGIQRTISDVSRSPATQAVKAGLNKKKPKNPEDTDIFGK